MTKKKTYLLDFGKEIHSCFSKDDILTLINDYIIIRDQKNKLVLKFKVDNNSFFTKIWFDESLIRRFKDFVKQGRRGIREVYGWELLKSAGLKVPELISYGEKKNNVLSGFSYLITREVPNSYTMDQVLKNRFDENIIKLAAHALYNVHKNDLVYGDFNYENYLIDDANYIYYLDWLGIRKSTNIRDKLRDVINFVYEMKYNSNLPLSDKINSYFLQYYQELNNSFGELNAFTNNINSEVKKLFNRKKYMKILRKFG